MTSQIQRQIPLCNQESVWDYPRPPRVESVPQRVRVVFNGVTIAESDRAFRVLETSHPPVYYIPPEDIRMETLAQTARHTFCEFKGAASYWTIKVDGRESREAGWSYPKPAPGFEAIRDHIAFYATRVDESYVGDEKVTPQAGDFYGGWITSKVVGPFKGEPGTQGW